MKFDKKKNLENHIIEKYLNPNEINVKFETHYIKVTQIDTSVNLYSKFRLFRKNTIEKEATRKRKASELEKEKSRKRNATECSKEKSGKRNATQSSKENSRKRNATESSKENSRKRSSTENTKEKCRQCNATENAKQKWRERKTARKLNNTTRNCIKTFKTAVTDGPYYICIVCNRCLYKEL